jgi:putative hydroxymethylpyrimidine transport system ATP-binding protein
MPPGDDPLSSPSPTIEIRQARLELGGRVLFDGLNLDVPAARFCCLLGPSGVGKTTLLRLVAGLTAPQGNTQVAAADGKPLPGRIAWMGQQDLLLPWASVLDNVMIGIRLRGARPDSTAQARALGLLQQVGLADRAGDRPAALSGGMRQRVALARTLFEDRPIVLMDEPFSALDALNRLRLGALAARLLAGRTVLLVTHDPMEALRLGHRVLVMTGQPATLSAPIIPAGESPRPPDLPELLQLQGRLLAELAREAEP